MVETCSTQRGSKPRDCAMSESDEAIVNCPPRTQPKGNRFPHRRGNRGQRGGGATWLRNGGRLLRAGPVERQGRDVGHGLRQIELALVKAEWLSVPIGHDHAGVSLANPDRR